MRQTIHKHDATRLLFQRNEFFFFTPARKSTLDRHGRQPAIAAYTNAGMHATVVTLKNIKCAFHSMGLFLCASKAAHTWTARIRWGTHGSHVKNGICAYRVDISSIADGINHLGQRRKRLSKGVGLHYGYIEQSTIHNSPRRYPFHGAAVACGASDNAAFIG